MFGVVVLARVVVGRFGVGGFVGLVVIGLVVALYWFGSWF